MDEKLERELSDLDIDRRNAIRKMIVATAFAIPAVTSFDIGMANARPSSPSEPNTPSGKATRTRPRNSGDCGCQLPYFP